MHKCAATERPHREAASGTAGWRTAEERGYAREATLFPKYTQFHVINQQQVTNTSGRPSPLFFGLLQ